MATEIANALRLLQPDPWRREAGFSPEIEAAQVELFNQNNDPVPIMRQWLSQHQPCLFGKMAARNDMIHYCVLRERDVETDESACHLIQQARTAWKRDAINGLSSAFVILFICPALANAVPDASVFNIASRLCSLYLRDVEVGADEVLVERVCYEKPGPARTTWEWLAGVNYFCAHGDKRWWHDHRIPGGMAFSINSVGHMAKSGKIAEAMRSLNVELDLPEGEFAEERVSSLGDALVLAMKTIQNASAARSGKATMLSRLVPDPNAPALPECPVDRLPSALDGMNHCRYGGWYHTDVTLPSLYFRSDIDRPGNAEFLDLDFTYLFNNELENPAHETMGRGVQIREEEAILAHNAIAQQLRIAKMMPRELDPEEAEQVKRQFGL